MTIIGLQVKVKANCQYNVGVKFVESGVRSFGLNLDLPFTGSVSLAKLLNISVPQFLHL